MRHHRRADDADRDVEHLRIGEDLALRHEAVQDFGDRRCGRYDLNPEADRDHHQQRDDEGLEETETAVHQDEQQERIERREQRAADQRDAEQELQRDRGADDLGEIAGDDRRLAGQPQQEVHRRRIGGAAGLREVAVGDDAEPCRQRLQQDRHQIREQDDGEQRVAELRPAGEVGRPIAGVHVADGDEIARADEGEHPAPPAARGRNGDRGVDLGEALGGGRIGAPAGGVRRQIG